MRRLHEFLFVRHRHNWLLLLRFAVVGASGVLVNLLTLVIVKKLGPGFNQAIVPVPGTEFNVRWYHAYSTFAFLVANLWNFQLNRTWTPGRRWPTGMGWPAPATRWRPGSRSGTSSHW